MNKIILIFCFLIINSCISADIERRAAIDVGSGGTKLTIADVDTDTNQIAEVILETSFPVAYQASLDRSHDGKFDEETKNTGLKVFKDIQQLASTHQVQRISAIATSAFRKANNTKKFIEEIEEQTQIKVKVIPQHEEGEIAFFSAIASGAFNKEEVLVLDVGTGSFQMTTTDDNQELTVYMGESMGSQAFKSYIMDTIQNKDEGSNSPNPISEEDLKMADSYARAFARKAYPVIKQKIKDHHTIVGIGRLFYNSVGPVASENGVITRDGLRAFINNSLGKEDEDLNNPFASVDVSNSILVLAVMKALHIQEIQPIETTTTKGMLASPSYWE